MLRLLAISLEHSAHAPEGYTLQSTQSTKKVPDPNGTAVDFTRFLVASAQQRSPRRSRVLNFMFLSKRIPICCSDVNHSAGIIRFDVGFPGFGLVETFGQGRPMSLYSPLARKASSFSLFSDSMLQDESLPLADVINSELFKQAFKEFDVDFGSDDDAV